MIVGNGVILWFESDNFEGVLDRVEFFGIQLDRGPVKNPDAKQMEIWLTDPNGYKVVIAGKSEYERNPL